MRFLRNWWARRQAKKNRWKEYLGPLNVGPVYQSYAQRCRVVGIYAGDRIMGWVSVPEDLLEEKADPPNPIRTWEGVMKPARMKGDKQMWRLMERETPEVMRRVATNDIREWCIDKYGLAAWEG